MARDVMAVEIENRYIKIVIGSRGKISKSGILNTPEGAIQSDRIIDVEAVAKVINEFKVANKVTTGDIIYTVHGQDTIIRHTEIAIMEEAQVGQAAIMEIGQYLPKQGANYYIDYQIIDKVSTDEKKVYKVLVAAAPRVKINGYVELTSKLNMKLKAIDILPISASRIFKNYFEKNSKIVSVGIIDIENKFSSIVILDKGKIFIEKEVNKGIHHAVNIVKDKIGKNYEEAYSYFMSKFNFAKQTCLDETYEAVKNNFDDIFKTFEMVVKFYTNGKTKKTLDKVFVIGEGAKIYGIEAYLQEAMATDVTVIEKSENIKLKVNFQNQSDFNHYLNVYGSLIRKGKKELNLIPHNRRRHNISIFSSVKINAIAAGLIIAFITASAVPIIISKCYSNKVKNSSYELRNLNSLQKEHDALSKKITTYNSRVKLVDKLIKNKAMINVKIQNINKYVPSGIKIDGVQFDSENGMVVSGETADGKLPAKFVADLQVLGKYKDARLKTIMNDAASENLYKFTVNLGDGSSAKNNSKG